MAPLSKLNVKLDFPRITEVGDQRCVGRDYRALLRSTGHLFRDGRWLDEGDEFSGFYTYRELENPGLGSLRTAIGPEFYRTFVPPFNQEPKVPLTWRPALSRIQHSAYLYPDEDLPQPVVPPYSDYVLPLNVLGTDYIRRFRPGNPLASLSQFVIELREIPRLVTLSEFKSRKFKSLGSEYLNVEFGWKPFLKDLVQLYQFQQKVDSELNKLIKNNGVYIKRRSKREAISTSSEISSFQLPRPFDVVIEDGVPEYVGPLYLSGPRAGSPDRLMTGSGHYNTWTETSTVSWYVGTFVYYVQDIGSSRWKDRMVAQLLGGNIDPITLWSVYPWTWLVDWFGNVGTIISNLTSRAADYEAVLNSHVMQEITTRDVVEAHVEWDSYVLPGAVVPVEFSVPSGNDMVRFSILRKQKLRRQASPFGFGLRSWDFDLRKTAILAALLSKTQRPSAGRFIRTGHVF